MLNKNITKSQENLNNSIMVFTAFKDGSNTTNQLTDGTQGLPVTKESKFVICYDDRFWAKLY